MGHGVKTFKEAVALALRVWGGAWSLLAFAVAFCYIAVRTALHLKRTPPGRLSECGLGPHKPVLPFLALFQRARRS